MSAGGPSAHMVAMTTSTKPADRTYRAAIAIVFEFHGSRTIVMLPGNSWVSQELSLTDVTVTLREGEIFMVSNGKGETRYYRDLDDAAKFSRSCGNEGSPDAIVILSPTAGKNGISEMITVRVHERAVAVVAP